MLSSYVKNIFMEGFWKRSSVSGNENNLKDFVCEALLMTDDISQAVIEIEHKEGIITLNGTVQSEEDRLVADGLTRQQEGTVDVINKLHIMDHELQTPNPIR